MLELTAEELRPTASNAFSLALKVIAKNPAGFIGGTFVYALLVVPLLLLFGFELWSLDAVLHVEQFKLNVIGFSSAAVLLVAILFSYSVMIANQHRCTVEILDGRRPEFGSFFRIRGCLACAASIIFWKIAVVLGLTVIIGAPVIAFFTAFAPSAALTRGFWGGLLASSRIAQKYAGQTFLLGLIVAGCSFAQSMTYNIAFMVVTPLISVILMSFYQLAIRAETAAPLTPLVKY